MAAHPPAVHDGARRTEARPGSAGTAPGSSPGSSPGPAPGPTGTDRGSVPPSPAWGPPGQFCAGSRPASPGSPPEAAVGAVRGSGEFCPRSLRPRPRPVGLVWKLFFLHLFINDHLTSAF